MTLKELQRALLVRPPSEAKAPMYLEPADWEQAFAELVAAIAPSLPLVLPQWIHTRHFLFKGVPIIYRGTDAKD